MNGGFAPCPTCGNTYATKVRFTWWGGLLGPAILSHVRCNQCGTQYNGKTGKSNNTAIGIYVGVGVGISLLIILMCCGLNVIGNMN